MEGVMGMVLIRVDILGETKFVVMIRENTRGKYNKGKRLGLEESK